MIVWQTVLQTEISPQAAVLVGSSPAAPPPGGCGARPSVTGDGRGDALQGFLNGFWAATRRGGRQVVRVPVVGRQFGVVGPCFAQTCHQSPFEPGASTGTCITASGSKNCMCGQPWVRSTAAGGHFRLRRVTFVVRSRSRAGCGRPRPNYAEWQNNRSLRLSPDTEAQP
jgi:hypothetical protein